MLSPLCGAISWIMANWLGRRFCLNFGKTPNMERFLLLEFDRLWGAKHAINYKSGKEIIWYFQRLKSMVVR
jgi:hypothetical protein